jgi:hypothetical protein
VRRAMRKEKELQEKLEFYNMKLIGYKGVSYDRIGSSGSRSSGDSELLYWLDKIDKVEESIMLNKRIVNDYKLLVDKLDSIENDILNEILDNRINKNVTKPMTKSHRYQIINKIVVNWMIQNSAYR